MVRADLTLHIITISVLYCLFFPCGAEVDTKLNEVYEDSHEITPNTTKEQFNSSDSNVPAFVPRYSSRKRPSTTEQKVIYIVIAAAFCIIILAIKCCCKYMKEQEHDEGDTIVHPPPAQTRAAFAPSVPTSRSFVPPNCESVVLPPNDAYPVFVSAYNPSYGRTAPTRNNAENLTVRLEAENENTNPLTDLPPSYESVVNSAKDRNIEYQYPAVSRPTPTAPDQEKY